MILILIVTLKPRAGLEENIITFNFSKDLLGRPSGGLEDSRRGRTTPRDWGGP